MPHRRDRSTGHCQGIHHGRDVVHAEHGRSAFERHHIGGDGSRQSLARVAPPASRPRKVLREVPTTTGRPRPRSRPTAQQLQVVPGVLPKPMPGVHQIRRSSTPRPPPAPAAPPGMPSPRPPRPRSAASSCMVRGLPCMCIRQQSAPASASTPRTRGRSGARHVVDQTRPLSARSRATAALLVSTERVDAGAAAPAPHHRDHARVPPRSARHGLGAGPGGLPTHVQDVRAGPASRSPWATAASGPK